MCRRSRSADHGGEKHHRLREAQAHIRLSLAQGISLALEFKLGGEVLRTVLVRELSELMVLGLVILLRGALTFIIHWEIKNEEARLDETAGHEEPVLAETGRRP